MSTMELIVYPLVHLVRLYAVHINLKLLFSRKNHKLSKCYFLALVCYYMVAQVAIFVVPSGAVVLLTHLTFIFGLSFFYEGGFVKKLLAPIVCTILGLAAEAIIVSVYSALTQHSIAYIEANSRVQLFLVIASEIARLLLVALLSVLMKEARREWIAKWKIVYWFLVFMIPITSIFVIHTLLKGADTTITSAAWSIAMVLLADFLVLYLYELLINKIAMEQENHLLRQQNILLEQHFHKMEQVYDFVSTMRHDIKYTLVNLLDQIERTGATHEAVHAAFQQVLGQIQIGEGQSRSGFPALDVIINYKAEQALQFGIQIVSQINLPHGFDLDDRAVTIILGNALDNAIESCQKVPPEKRVISLHITQHASNFYMRIGNSYEEELLLGKDGIPQTRKKEPGHGLGFKSIYHIVRERKGTMNFSAKDHRFVLEILLYAQKSIK